MVTSDTRICDHEKLFWELSIWLTQQTFNFVPGQVECFDVSQFGVQRVERADVVVREVEVRQRAQVVQVRDVTQVVVAQIQTLAPRHQFLQEKDATQLLVGVKRGSKGRGTY